MASWITDIFGVNAKLLVEVASGANPSGDSSLWTWTDITGDVFDEPGLAPGFGRSDEASQAQPGKWTFRLDNRSGNYSKGGQSANYPNVRIGVPVRLRIDPDGGGYVVAWQGQVVSWKPTWPYHSAPYVDCEAAGWLRRLSQGQKPVESVFRRALAHDSHTIAYWPMEDGTRSSSFAPAVSSSTMTWGTTGPPNLAANSSIDGTNPLPTLNKAILFAAVPTYTTSTGFVAVRMLADFPTSGESSGTLLAVWFTQGTLGHAYFTYNSSTQAIDLALYDSTGSLITIQAGLAGSATGARRCSFEFIQFGPSVIVAWIPVNQLGTYPNYSTYTAAGYTVGLPTWVLLGDTVLSQTAVGHLVVQDGYDFPAGYSAQQSFLLGRDHWNAWSGEYADDRIKRLAAENSTTVTVMGGSDTRMGPQSVDTLLNLLRECETADGGALHDGNGMDTGLMYMSRAWMESRAADITLNAQGDLIPPFTPVDDDRLIRNKATITRTKGPQVSYEDVSTSLNGSSYVGIYEASATVNLYTDDDTLTYAQWVVNLGTYYGYRYGDLTVDPRRSNTIADARTLLGLMPGMRIDVSNLPAALTAFPQSGTVSFLVQSVSHTIQARVWQTRFTCSPYSPWQVGQISPNTDGSSITYMGGARFFTDEVTADEQAGFEVDLPEEAGVGDLLLIWATVRNSGTGTINVPADWTALVTSGNCVLIGRFMRPGEPNPILSVSNAVANELAILYAVALRGVYPDITACVHASAAQLNGATTNTVAYPGLTITQPNCAVMVFAWKQDAWTSSSAVSGMTKMFDLPDSNGNHASIGGSYKIETTASNLAAGNMSLVDANSSISRAVSIAFLPAATPNCPLRLDTPGSTLASSISAGATSMGVASTAATSVSYVAIGAAVAGNNVSVVPTLPASIQTGDLLLCWASIRNTAATVGTPAGWTSLVSVANCTLLGRYVMPGETAPTVTFSGGAAGDTTIAQILALRGTGRQLSTVVHNSATQTNASAQNVAYPALTVTQDGCVVLWFQWKQNAWTGKAPIAFEISDTPEAVGSGASIGIDYVPQTTAANVSSGTDTVTGGSAAVSKAFVVAIKPHTTGANWTTSSSDYPMDLDVGGTRITATACSGTGTPQTFTINAAPAAVTSGATVKLWDPAGLSR